jgi:hypothetical protein
MARFDALADHGYAERMGHRGHCSDDFAVAGAPADLYHEAPVDLHALQVRK